jgi:hypothetical protein
MTISQKTIDGFVWPQAINSTLLQTLAKILELLILKYSFGSINKPPGAQLNSSKEN